MKLLRQSIFYLLLALAATYVLDTATYYLRGKPGSTVQVSRLLAIPLKGGKTEYDPAGSSAVACTSSLFPQSSATPCWYLRRNAQEIIKY